MNKLAPVAAAFALTLAFSFCSENQSKKVAEKSAPVAKTVALPAVAEDSDFEKYWFAGKAEVSSFDLEQERYGQKRTGGDVVLVFVTEDFSRKKQVKLDDALAAGADRVPILKLNAAKKFATGIYDYSMLQSVFTPIDWKNEPRSLKTTCSSQEWCGHTFTQLNLEGKNWRLRGFSYFETEGDADEKLPAAMLEDELWTRLRIDPSSVPTGEVELIPASFFSRLKHEKLKPEKARITMQLVENERVMKVEYADLGRGLSVRFEEKFPHRIIGWQETQGGKTTVEARLKKTILSDYWAKNGNDFQGLRDTLRLATFSAGR